MFEDVATLEILWATVTWIARILPRLCSALTPQLVQTHSFNEPLPPRRVFPPSWLDSLRGFASFAAYGFHYMCAFSDIAVMPYAIDKRHKCFIQLPIILISKSFPPIPPSCRRHIGNGSGHLGRPLCPHESVHDRCQKKATILLRFHWQSAPLKRVLNHQRA